MLVKIEAVINSRPITFQSDDPMEPRPLSPSDLLIGRRLTTLPVQPSQPDPDRLDFNRVDATNRIKYLERLANDFWTRWQKEYLRERSLHYERRRNIQPIRVGEVVLIQADNVKRQEWKMGVISELHPSADGIVRSVTLRTTNGDLRRPVQRLCALELNEDEDDPFLYGPAEDDQGPNLEELPDPDPPLPVPQDHEPEAEEPPEVEFEDRPEQIAEPGQPAENNNDEVPLDENPVEDLQDGADSGEDDAPILQGGSVVDFPAATTRRGRPIRRPARYQDFV